MTAGSWKYLSNVSLHKIDTTDTYDDMIKEISKEIVQSIIKRKWDFDINTVYKLNTEYECIKFYLTMIILRKLSSLVIKYYIRYYQAKIYFILKEDVKKYNKMNLSGEQTLDAIFVDMSNKLKKLYPSMRMRVLHFQDKDLKDTKVYGINNNELKPISIT